MKVLGNVPCVRCGHGDECHLSGIKMIFGPEATVDTVGIHCFGEQAEAMEAARELGRQIAAALERKGEQ